MSDTTAKPTPPLDTWASVELMGHVHVWGRLSEEEHFGVKMGRVDIPSGDGEDAYTTQWFGGASVYRITPTTEEVAREMAGYRPRRIGAFTRPATFVPDDEPDDREDDSDDDGGATRDDIPF